MVETIDHLTAQPRRQHRALRDGRRPTTTSRPAAIEADAAKLEATVEQLEFRRMFNNPADPSNCFLDIQAGAGGTEACDWAAMLLRQYLQVLRAQGLQDRGDGRDRGRRRRHPQRHDQDRGRLRVRPAAHRDRRAPAGAQEPVRLGAAAATPASPASSSTPRSTTRSRSRSTRPTCAPTPSAPPAPAASTSTRPTRRCA